MMNIEQKIRKFFDDNSRRFNDNLAAGAAVDAKDVRASYADYFVESSPNGGQGIT